MASGLEAVRWACMLRNIIEEKAAVEAGIVPLAGTTSILNFVSADAQFCFYVVLGIMDVNNSYYKI